VLATGSVVIDAKTGGKLGLHFVAFYFLFKASRLLHTSKSLWAVRRGKNKPLALSTALGHKKEEWSVDENSKNC